MGQRENFNIFHVYNGEIIKISFYFVTERSETEYKYLNKIWNLDIFIFKIAASYTRYQSSCPTFLSETLTYELLIITSLYLHSYSSFFSFYLLYFLFLSSFLSPAPFLSYYLPFSPPPFPFFPPSLSFPFSHFDYLFIPSIPFSFFSSPLLALSISLYSFLSLSSFLFYSLTFSPPSFPFLHFLPPFLSRSLPLTRYIFSPLHTFLPSLSILSFFQFLFLPSSLALSTSPYFLSLSSFLSCPLPFSPRSFPFLPFLFPFLFHSYPLTIFFLLSTPFSLFLPLSFLSFNFFSSPPLLALSISFSSFLSLSSFISYFLPFSPPSFPSLPFLSSFLSYLLPLPTFFCSPFLPPFVSLSFLSFNFFSSPPLLALSISFSPSLLIFPFFPFLCFLLYSFLSFSFLLYLYLPSIYTVKKFIIS